MHKLAALCVRRPVFATMLILALVVVGGFSYFSLGVDLTPKVDVPTVSITVVNPEPLLKKSKPISPSASRTRSIPSAILTMLNPLRFKGFRR